MIFNKKVEYVQVDKKLLKDLRDHFETMEQTHEQALKEDMSTVQRKGVQFLARGCRKLHKRVNEALE